MNTETSYRTRTLDHIIEEDVGKTLRSEEHTSELQSLS